VEKSGGHKNAGVFENAIPVNHLGGKTKIPFYDLVAFGYDIGLYYNQAGK
jgi:hypothetical protein